MVNFVHNGDIMVYDFPLSVDLSTIMVRGGVDHCHPVT